MPEPSLERVRQAIVDLRKIGGSVELRVKGPHAEPGYFTGNLIGFLEDHTEIVLQVLLEEYEWLRRELA